MNLQKTIIILGGGAGGLVAANKLKKRSGLANKSIMKKLLSLTITILIFVFSFAFSTFSFAQGMMESNMISGNNTIAQSDDGLPAEALAQAGHTAREEAEGKIIWEKLQAEELKCENLTDDDFGALGEYFMGQMAGEQHEVMNNMVIQMMGEDGEKQMHVAMGKRMSGCDPNAPMPQNMMDNGMMGSGNNSMMGNFGTNLAGWFGWGFIILAIIALIRWIVSSSRHIAKSKSALDILKERYAKGEIDKKEFEEKKKDLS